MPIQTALDMFRVPDEQALHEHWDRALATMGRARRRLPTVVQAYVSDNRWVADCPECNGGMGVLPGLALTVCCDCAAECEVALPPDRRVAEIVLLARPAAQRHWMAHRGETAEDLARENLSHLEVS